jgi:gamma-glutamyl hydrolase
MGLVGKPHVIDFYRHPGQLDTVDVTVEGQKSKMYGNLPDSFIDHIRERRSMFYNHRYGFNMSLLADNEILNEFFTITAKGADDNGKEFIAGLEAKEYPIYTVQYHPERVLSEWNNKTHFDHPEEAAQSVVIQAQFFVGEARKNDQSFFSEEIKERFLIRGHEGVYINITWPNTYFYDKKSPIAYHPDIACPGCGNLDSYDCVDHDCSFITPQL